VTSAFGARRLTVKYLNLLQRMPTKRHERIGNATALSGNNPEAIGARVDYFSDLHLVIRIVMPIVFQQRRNACCKVVVNGH
jgi:hypothetical protein